ncbi:histone-fold-containing protein [Paraphaeosphaeria sporulosa]|uniref:DNA polymerase epsilon subunit D n=1 Tax=Paraphaeosphaeria sporulosa TaxID=1460663 RepID=A0A177D060_9PLEO|nr:histone-fold-containing protein [Paraphaeosphaeria sporulosa]OAG12936.1 histone-fold-containing protein [Paraphaeosphaeria sporulosa]
MPPRKSNVSTAAAEDSPKPPPKAARDEDDGLSDLNLPKSIVQRLAKGVLPPNTQIQKDALLAMSKGATVFVNYLTSTAAEHAARSGKKTVMPKDVFDALQELEFDFMLQRVEAEVHKFTSIQADKRNTYRKKVREEKKAAKGEPTNGAAEDEQPPTKRARRSDGAAGAPSDEDDVDETVEDVEQEDEDVEDDEVDEEAPEEEPTEDLLEEREKEASDDDMADGDESD